MNTKTAPRLELCLPQYEHLRPDLERLLTPQKIPQSVAAAS